MGPHPKKVLQLHHREYPDGLHHRLVWRLLSLRPQGTTEDSAYGPVHHCGQAYCHPGSLYQAVSEEGPATLVIDCSLFSRTASGSGAPSLGPRGFYPQAISPEQLIKWLSRLFALPPSFYAVASLLLSMHIHFNNSPYMYILPQLH
jgi:hypothetical protein